MDRRRALAGSGDVAIDFEDGYRQAVQHLRELGHRRIGFIGGNEGIRTLQIRLEAFQQALRDAGLTYNPKFTRYGDYRVAGGDAAMRSLLKEPRRPTAVMTCNDLTAFGALRALHALGVNVPSQMSVVGFDGILLGDTMYPPLTTIYVSPLDITQACIKALDHSKANIAKRGLLLDVGGKLLLRDSTAHAPAK